MSLSLDEWSLSTLISRSRVAKIIALMQQTSALCSHIDLFTGSTIAIVWDLREGQISKLKV